MASPEPAIVSTNGFAPDDRKLAEIICERIQMSIIDRGWPVGEVIGSEADLLAIYGVSRAALREAIRLLEHHNVAYMRRGPGGGLVVAEPAPEPVTQAASVYLRYRAVSVAHLFETRLALELAAVRAATERLDERGVARLREALEYEKSFGAEVDATIHDFHVVVGELSGNPALQLFGDALTQLSAAGFIGTRALFDRHASMRRPVSELATTQRVHRGIAEAMIAGDVALAQHRTTRHLQAMAEALGANTAG